MATRITILAVPPVIPMIRDELQMTETEVGLLIGLPILTFALAAIPGSLLIARWGAVQTMAGGLALVALAGAARAAAPDIWLLLLASLMMGGGVAIMQPAMPTLVRVWLPHRIGLGTAVSSNGMLVGVMLAPALSIPLVLPLTGQSWRLDLVVWALPVAVTAIVFLAFAPRTARAAGSDLTGRWWPDWRSPLVWLLGLTFGSNNALFYGVNAFLPDYLVANGRADLTAAALGWMNGAQMIASTLLLVTAERLQRRVWPYLVFGPGTFLGVLGIMLGSGSWLVVPAAGLIGFSLAVTFVLTIALLPVLSPADEIHHISAGMFTVSYSCAVVTPVICGALWDLTGRPSAAFALLGICPITLTTIGVALSLHAKRTRAAAS
jgi:CP family cyanate transporter-like MFS transporter